MTTPDPGGLAQTPAPLASFRRCNIFDAQLRAAPAHDGDGHVLAVRLVEGRGDPCNFLDYVELPAGTSIGDHRHSDCEVEFYLILAGTGSMRLDEEQFPVRAGDVIRNRPGGLHGLRNTSDDWLRVFVFELATPGAAS